MINRILKAGFLNLLNSLFSVFLTFIIVERLGVGIVGELYVLLANCSVIMLLNIIFPPTYSLVQIQKSQIFMKYMFNMYFYVQFLIVIIAFFVFFEKYSYWSFAPILYCYFSSWINFYDVILQSKGLIKEFYLCTLIGSVSKLVALLIVMTNYLDLINIMLVLTFGQSISLLSMFFVNKRKGRKIIKFFSIFGLKEYYILKFKDLKGFYINAVFKRLFDNLPAIVFGGIISSNAIGIFSIYQKCLVFGVSFIRIIESFLLTRVYYNMLSKNIKLATVLGSIIFTFFASLLYSYFTVGLMVSYSLIVSLLIIPIFFTVEVRSRFIKGLAMKHVNVAMFLSMVTIYACSFIPFHNELNSVFLGYSLMLIVQSLWLGKNIKKINL